MPCRDVLADRESLTASRDDAAFGNGIDSYGDIIMRVDLEYVHRLLLCQFGNVSFDTDFSHAVQMSRNGIGKAVDSRQVFAPPITACHDGLDVISRRFTGLFFDKGQFIFIIVDFISIARP